MDTLIAIDPGKKGCGVAVFYDGRLGECEFIEGTRAEIVERGDTVASMRSPMQGISVVLEKPVVYDRKNWEGDPNDLIEITITGALLASAMHIGGFEYEFEAVTPQQWKGQTPKEIMNKRVWKFLHDSDAPDHGELSAALYGRRHTTGGKWHNVLDAIGIGLWRLKRL